MRNCPGRGFTIIELLVVMTVIALLLTIAAPRYFQQIDRAKEATLKENLHVMRDAIDKYRSDKGVYPGSLQQLSDHRYLRAVPVDPITERADWLAIAPPAAAGSTAEGKGVSDVRSSARGRATDGSDYAKW